MELEEMLNREIYQLDPTLNRLENNGVAEVKDDQSSQALKTLRYEIQNDYLQINQINNRNY